MNTLFNFNNPTNLLFGSGTLNELGSLSMPGKKAMVLISRGKSTKANGYLDCTLAQNNGAGDGTGSYGLSWWMRQFGAENYDTYYAFGAWGQYIFVVPELELVTVIASEGPQLCAAPVFYRLCFGGLQWIGIF